MDDMIAEGFGGAASNGRAQESENSSLSAIIAELIRNTGSGKAAAAALGISPTTLYRWRNYAEDKEQGVKQKPADSMKRKMIAASRRAACAPAFERRIRSAATTLKIKGQICVSRDCRPRTIHPTDIPGRKMGNILTSWLDGDDERAERLLWKAIDTHYVNGIEIDSIERMWFE